MPLRLMDIVVSTEGETHPISVESISNGLVLLEYEPYPPAGSILHWRIGNWNKPPLDLTLSAGTGGLLRINYFLQNDDTYSEIQLNTKYTSRAGLPRFDTSVWKGDDVYLDIHDEIVHSWINDSILVLMFANVEKPISMQLRLAPSVSILFNGNDELLGIKMQGFTSDDRALLQTLSNKSD